MNLQATTNDNAAPALRQPAIIEREADFRRLRAEYLAHNERWDPLHQAALRATEAAIKALDGAPCIRTDTQQWALMGAISDATGATAADAAGCDVERRMYDALGEVIDTPAGSLRELAAKARAAILDLHSIDDAASVDCEEADWDVRVLTRLVLDIERLAGRQA